MTLRLATLLVALIASACVLGCSEDEPASTTTVEEREQPPGFAATADSLCSDAMAEQEELRRELGGRQITLGDRARLLVELAPARIALAEDLAELEPPKGEGKEFEELVASAERRGEASALAGELWEKNAPKDPIAEQAAIEHDERELFVEIARDLGLGACAEVLSHIEEEGVAASALALFSPKAEERCAVIGERLAEERFGGIDACRASEDLLVPPLAGDESATVAEADGMDQVFALARVRTPSGELRIRLTYEDGAYKVDKVD